MYVYFTRVTHKGISRHGTHITTFVSKTVVISLGLSASSCPGQNTHSLRYHASQFVCKRTMMDHYTTLPSHHDADVHYSELKQ